MSDQESHDFWEAFELLQKGDYVLARSIFERLSLDDAKIQLAYMYQMGLGGSVDFEKSEEIYLDLMGKGRVDIAYDLAALYLRVDNTKNALHYFEVSSSTGNPSASYWVSQLYSGYKGSVENEVFYLKYLAKAAEEGHLFAKRDLARLKYKSAKSFFDFVKYRFEHIKTKLICGLTVLRDLNDLRVR